MKDDFDEFMEKVNIICDNKIDDNMKSFLYMFYIKGYEGGKNGKQI